MHAIRYLFVNDSCEHMYYVVWYYLAGKEYFIINV